MAQSQSNQVENVISITRKSDESRFDSILDAAEKVFAASGFEGAKMRQIAEHADVAQGLIHYHFSNKEMLFESLVARRSEQINRKRAEKLALLFKAETQPGLEDVIDALFRPTIEVGLVLAKDGGGFSRILASMANSAGAREQNLAERYYDPIARQFVDAFRQVQPSLGKADAVWSYMFAIGVGVTMMAKTGRSLRLSDGVCDDGNIDDMLKKIVTYICGGIRALADNQANSK